ncbi:MAG: 5-dehydro-4-deoxy-D-glucuronate isomerase, partial [Bacteroidota bacterium]
MIHYEERLAAHPNDVKHYTTEQLRDHFLVSKVMETDKISLTYSSYDRYIVGGAVPASKPLELEPIEPLKTEFFLKRREMGIINVGGDAVILADGTSYDLAFKDALYLGMGTQKVIFQSKDGANPARLYINSAPAHKSYPSK